MKIYNLILHFTLLISLVFGLGCTPSEGDGADSIPNISTREGSGGSTSQRIPGFGFLSSALKYNDGNGIKIASGASIKFPNNPEYNSTANSKGKFSLNLLPGTYDIIAESEVNGTTFSRKFSNILVGLNGETQLLNPILLPTGQIKGKVKIINDQTTSLAGFLVSIPGTSYLATTNENGEFVISNVPPGSYNKITVSRDGLNDGTFENVTVNSSETFEVGTTFMSISSGPEGEISNISNGSLFNRELFLNGNTSQFNLQFNTNQKAKLVLISFDDSLFRNKSWQPIENINISAPNGVTGELWYKFSDLNGLESPPKSIKYTIASGNLSLSACLEYCLETIKSDLRSNLDLHVRVLKQSSSISVFTPLSRYRISTRSDFLGATWESINDNGASTQILEINNIDLTGEITVYFEIEDILGNKISDSRSANFGTKSELKQFIPGLEAAVSTFINFKLKTSGSPYEFGNSTRRGTSIFRSNPYNISYFKGATLEENFTLNETTVPDGGFNPREIIALGSNNLEIKGHINTNSLNLLNSNATLDRCISKIASDNSTINLNNVCHISSLDLFNGSTLSIGTTSTFSSVSFFLGQGFNYINTLKSSTDSQITSNIPLFYGSFDSNAIINQPQKARLVISQDAGTSFQTYGQAEGLDAHFIFDVESDNSGNHWVGTDNGLYKVNTSTLTITSIPKSAFNFTSTLPLKINSVQVTDQNEIVLSMYGAGYISNDGGANFTRVGFASGLYNFFKTKAPFSFAKFIGYAKDGFLVSQEFENSTSLRYWNYRNSSGNFSTHSSAPGSDSFNFFDPVIGANPDTNRVFRGPTYSDNYSSDWYNLSGTRGVNTSALEATRTSTGEYFYITNTAVYKSSDSGLSFSNITPNYSGIVYFGIVRDSSDIIYIASSRGLIKSTDLGSTFSLITENEGLPSNIINEIHVDDSDTIIMGISGSAFSRAL